MSSMSANNFAQVAGALQDPGMHPYPRAPRSAYASTSRRNGLSVGSKPNQPLAPQIICKTLSDATPKPRLLLRGTMFDPSKSKGECYRQEKGTGGQTRNGYAHDRSLVTKTAHARGRDSADAYNFQEPREGETRKYHTIPKEYSTLKS